MTLVISIFSFLSIFGGALIGMQVALRLPEKHLSSETRTAVSVSMAVIGSLSGLVLSLLLATENTSFRGRADAVSDLAVSIVKLNRALVRYGPEASAARATLVQYVHFKINSLASSTDDGGLGLTALYTLESLDDQITQLHPETERNRHVQARALQFVDAIADTRWLLVSKASTALPGPFLILLIFWLALLFASFGLFAPRNGTVVFILLLCALAISGGILMILELGTPTQGIIRVPILPLQNALVEIASKN